MYLHRNTVKTQYNCIEISYKTRENKVIILVEVMLKEGLLHYEIICYLSLLLAYLYLLIPPYLYLLIPPYYLLQQNIYIMCHYVVIYIIYNDIGQVFFIYMYFELNEIR